MVQATFTKQKRELSKAMSWIEKLRGIETLEITTNPKGEELTREKKCFVDFTPEEISTKVFEITKSVVSQHGMRQQANSKNKGCFRWNNIEVDLTVPQLRTLQEAYKVFSDLIQNLPRRSPKLIPNTTIEGHPAFAHRIKEHKETKYRYVPYEEETTTRVRTYEEKYEEHTHNTQLVDVDYGINIKVLKNLEDLLLDLQTAIQVAIDEANTKGSEPDPILEKTIEGICSAFLETMTPSTSEESSEKKP